MLKIEIQKVKVILFAVLLCAGFTGGQAWGSKELTFEEWKESNDPKAQEFKEQIVNQQKKIDADSQKINELKELIKEKEIFCQTEDYKKLIEVDEQLRVYKENEEFEENASARYLKEKPKKIKELKEKLQTLSKTVEQRIELGKKIQQYQTGHLKGEGIAGTNYYLTARKEELNKKTNALTQLQNDQKQYFETQKKISTIFFNTRLYSFISGMLSAIKMGTDLANKKSFLGAIKNNWGLLGLGAAASGLITGYNHKKLNTLEQDNPKTIFPNKKSIVTNGLFNHGLGMVVGAVAGYGTKKLFGN